MRLSNAVSSKEPFSSQLFQVFLKERKRLPSPAAPHFGTKAAFWWLPSSEHSIFFPGGDRSFKSGRAITAKTSPFDCTVSSPPCLWGSTPPTHPFLPQGIPLLPGGPTRGVKNTKKRKGLPGQRFSTAAHRPGRTGRRATAKLPHSKGSAPASTAGRRDLGSGRRPAGPAEGGQGRQRSLAGGSLPSPPLQHGGCVPRTA